ncbi:hypothetical protein AA103196_2583 [Ameyamaea chiangmaiensis NBRC 103196]|uniref:Uncharacterized protein n=1 Tax=Ameyamaea chiangmaiensis TaxID=442969 RepID=A0A850PDK9_9PROT|nr:hypothetical protein [Ameyamaea chiangmaiensis]MBS4075615.1 hypothetical protein [Ameyamaea chiangmaiensis]NVN40366.1 hypothetical protein [Ameyamaea chiangmaiensis]GBQ70749.1 hypothetical protein AA103196_2583 [Ameyamaea chiangmaiensis NBRC 103196]
MPDDQFQDAMADLLDLLSTENTALREGRVTDATATLERKRALIAVVEGALAGVDVDTVRAQPGSREDLAALRDVAEDNRLLLEGAIGVQKEILALVAALPTRQDSYTANGTYRRPGTGGGRAPSGLSSSV